MPDKDLPRLDIDSVMPYDCIRLKYAWAEQSEKYHNGDINGRSIKDKLKD